MSNKFKITLVENRAARSMCETKSRYDVYLNGEKLGQQFYFNMTGYTGAYLPLPDSEGCLCTGEVSLTRLRKIVAELNRRPITVSKFWRPSPAIAVW